MYTMYNVYIVLVRLLLYRYGLSHFDKFVRLGRVRNNLIVESTYWHIDIKFLSGDALGLKAREFRWAHSCAKGPRGPNIGNFQKIPSLYDSVRRAPFLDTFSSKSIFHPKGPKKFRFLGPEAPIFGVAANGWVSLDKIALRTYIPRPKSFRQLYSKTSKKIPDVTPLVFFDFRQKSKVFQISPNLVWGYSRTWQITSKRSGPQIPKIAPSRAICATLRPTLIVPDLHQIGFVGTRGHA